MTAITSVDAESRDTTQRDSRSAGYPAVLQTAEETGCLTVGIVGLGYVGLPTALGYVEKGHSVIGIDQSGARLEAIGAGKVDLTPVDLGRLKDANSSDLFATSRDVGRLAEADVVLICVPTPVDAYLVPDHTYVGQACGDVVRVARPGQVLILTSTTSVGTTRAMLAEPLEQRGLRVGTDVFVAFSPERINPGSTELAQEQVPRVLGGMTEACSKMATEALRHVTTAVHAVSTPEAAELTKLLENTFRAVNIALANEFADVARALSLDITEIISAAASKPYGFMPFYPGPGVGGHCIPCDPHFLLWQMRRHRMSAPLISQAMDSIAHRPRRIVQRVVEELSKNGVSGQGAHLLIVGVAYKPGVEDVRETPAIEIIAELEALGIRVSFFDPYVEALELPNSRIVLGAESCDGSAYDAVLIHTLHPGTDLQSLAECEIVIDATYRTGLQGGAAVLA